MEKVETPPPPSPSPVHITAKGNATSFLSCDSNNNNNNNHSDDTGKLMSDDFEAPPSPPPLSAIQQPSLSIWSSHAEPPPVWSAPTDLNLFSSQTAAAAAEAITATTALLLNRQPSNPDSSYDSDDPDADLLTKIVSDTVDSSAESPQNENPQLSCIVQSESISAILLGTSQNQTAAAAHEDVNRTLSDTLIQEYPEWNIPNFTELKLLESSATAATATSVADDFDKISLSTDAEKPSSAQSPRLTAAPVVAPAAAKPIINHEEIYDPEKARLYEEKLKFAKKLGYTEDMVAIALANVGYHVSKNDFLNELICIGNSETAKDSREMGAADGVHPLGDYCQPNELVIRQQLDNNISSSMAKSVPPDPPVLPQLRPIVIDGSNVAIRFVLFELVENL